MSMIPWKACPSCGHMEVVVPVNEHRDNMYTFKVNGQLAMVAGFCAGCGIFRAYAYDPALCRHEPTTGPPRFVPQPPAPPEPPPLPKGARCPSCRSKKIEVAPLGRVQGPGWWVTCEKCQRAWQLVNGKINEGVSMGIAKPDEGQQQPPEGNRQQRRAAKRKARKPAKATGKAGG